MANRPSKSPQAIRVERPGKTLRELALEKMRDAIINRYFEPGSRLIEREVCTSLGVSRTVVREVLRHLESEGLVTIVPNKGPIVAEVDVSSAMQIYEIRGALEGMAARLCAEKNDHMLADKLETALSEIRKGYAQGDMTKVLASTSHFYKTMFSGVQRDIAWSVVSSLTGRINHLRSMTIRTKKRNIEGPVQMQKIVDAIRNGKGKDAETAAAAHVSRACEIALKILQLEHESPEIVGKNSA